MAALRLHRHLLQLPKCSPQCCRLSSRAAQAFPVLRGDILPIHKHVYEANSRNSHRCRDRYLELSGKVKLGGGENAILRHTQRNKKLLVRERLKLLLDDENFLELSPLGGLGLPYGDVPSAGCLTGVGRVCGIWCMFIANDATVKGGTAFPISVKKQLRAQEIAMQNRLPTVYLVDSGGAFLPLQAQLFPDKEHGGRTFYNEAIMSALRIPQVAVVCGSCTAGGAYIPTMAEETIMVDRIGTIFLAGPPLVKAATGEDVSAEELGGAKLHSRVSGCVDHFAATEPEAYSCARLIISTLNFDPPPDGANVFEDPLYDTRELAGLAPRDYSCTLDIKLILSRLVDGSKFLEFKTEYGTTLVTGFASIERNLVGIVASNGVLTHDAALKGSHFVQICNQRNIPLLFLQNTTSQEPLPPSLSKAEDLTNRLKAQASMMTSVACASVPKITVVVGGCHGGESFAMCGRSFEPNFFFLWPNARIGLVDADSAPPSIQKGDGSEDGEEFTALLSRLKEESSAFYSSARLWDDGVILPEDTRQVLSKCLQIIHQRKYEKAAIHSSPLLRM
ncbi:PREDICTED: methylcrotonoyl-CoA carboxylase beta chain, mitochondrial-like [Nanorana parkeri]|uniref:methylcrotonoyl-CoA carboxylase beta chain, mitochondrial-like n=1 Tax=Nanorana parkeri TaxID=125878 RepID=UPI0008541A9C|nr:PREDICTED: methylcrotonoyl-CoA carboxylase beta chain, mitochondrial-like [Nanorana parkeri]